MKKHIVLVIAIILLGGGASFAQQWFVESFAPTSRLNAIVPRASYVIPVQSETTVLGAMDAYAETEKRFSFSGRDFPGLGFLVEEINRKRSADGYYWILRINGTLSDKGASQARVAPGDIVEWRYEEGY